MESAIDVAPVRSAHRFDEAALGRYLEAHVAGFRGPLRVRQFEGGQSNPTYLLEDAQRRYVLRRKPPGHLLPSAHQVDREYRVLTALAATDVPVPRTYCLCEDDTVIGTAFYVMAFVEGRIFREPLLPRELPPAEVRALFAATADVLARLHRVQPAAVGLADYGRPGNYFERQIGRWSKIYRASETQTIEPMERLMEWLPRTIPAADETTIVHGDYRLGNMIVHPSEPRIVAVLDWELSTLGHPLADLAYTCVPWNLPAERLSGYMGLELASRGYPSEAELVADYCRHSGRADIPDWPFYVAFAMFRLAAISQGIAGRVRDGTAAGADAAERGARAPLLARRAWEILQPVTA
ncbi:MAG TPA: phosphotransferase [bacterium]|nr:phosphotransferase [bacterium]